MGPGRAPYDVDLSGRHVRISRPFQDDALALYEASHGPGCEVLWRWLADGPYASAPDFARAFADKIASRDPFFFVIRDIATGVPLGYCAFLRIVPEHGSIEIGNILYTPALQRSIAGTEAMYLMARHVFEDLGMRRYEWKCNVLNAPSQRAARRYGFSYEGIFRQHMIVKGESRDTAWFSMLDREWTTRKAAFEAWLAPSNFDPDGRQRRALSAV